VAPSNRTLHRLVAFARCGLLVSVAASCAAQSIPPQRLAVSPKGVAASQAAPPTAVDPSGAWFAAPPMLFARAAHAVVSSGTALYALAGTNGAPVLEVERFDGAAWTVETTLPGLGVNAPTAVFLNDRIYLIGGFNTTSNVPTGKVLVYDLTTHAWSEAAPLSNPRGGDASAVLDGKIHVVGGGNNVSTLNDHSVYDPATNTWAELAPLPNPEGSPAAVVYGGALYVIGGRSGTDDYGGVYRYNPATNAWEAGPAIDPRGTAGAAEYCGTLYVFGGESQQRNIALNEVLRLNLTSQVWQMAPAMPSARVYPRAVPFGGSIYLVGGSAGPVRSHAAPGLNLVERYHSDCTE
jgi:N-acetylneuraminic acid mutarotase